VTPREPLAPVTDARRAMPASRRARLAQAEATVRSLAEEHRRAVRSNLEWPLARAEHQLRYWRFVRAMCRIAAEAA
jgi:hypothetical protein